MALSASPPSPQASGIGGPPGPCSQLWRWRGGVDRGRVRGGDESGARRRGLRGRDRVASSQRMSDHNNSSRAGLTRQKLLVVNADDLGLSAGAIAASSRPTSAASSPAPASWCAGAAARRRRRTRAHPRLGVGLHLDFADGASVTMGAPVRGGEPQRSAAVRRESRPAGRPLLALIDRAPTHVDSHQHVHQESASAQSSSSRARRLGVPAAPCRPNRLLR